MTRIARSVSSLFQTNVRASLLRTNVVRTQFVQQFFEAIDLFVRTSLNTNQNAAATYSCFVYFRAILRNSSTDQRANQSTRRATCTRTSKRRRDWTSNDEIDTRQEQRCSYCRDCCQHRANRAADRTPDPQSICSM